LSWTGPAEVKTFLLLSPHFFPFFWAQIPVFFFLNFFFSFSKSSHSFQASNAPSSLPYTPPFTTNSPLSSFLRAFSSNRRRLFPSTVKRYLPSYTPSTNPFLPLTPLTCVTRFFEGDPCELLKKRFFSLFSPNSSSPSSNVYFPLIFFWRRPFLFQTYPPSNVPKCLDSTFFFWILDPSRSYGLVLPFGNEILNFFSPALPGLSAFLAALGQRIIPVFRNFSSPCSELPSLLVGTLFL